MNAPHFLIFNLFPQHHFPMFVHCWLETWIADDHEGRLTLVVAPAFVRSHPHLLATAARAPRGNVRIITPTPDEMEALRQVEADAARQHTGFTDLIRSGGDSAYVGLTIWALFTACAQRLGADLSMMCDMDQFLPLLISGAPSPPAIAGIYFATTFHYEKILGAAGRSEADRLAALRQRFMLARGMAHPHLKRLLFTDPYAASAVGGFPNPERVRYLPEPALLEPFDPAAVEAMRADLGIEPGRRVLIVLGALGERKGVDVLIDGLARLPAADGRAACLLIMGMGTPTYQAALDDALEGLRSTSDVQVVRRYGFLSDTAFSTAVHLSDVVVTLYRNHAGMSNLTLVAAAADRPVLCADDGLMGLMTRENGLGITVDIHDAAAVTRTLQQMIASPSSAFGDESRRRALVAAHQPAVFARSFFASLAEALE